MAKTYYAQSEHPTKTMTVGELIDQLSKQDPSAVVVFRTPLYGTFGSNTAYSIDAVAAEVLDRREDYYPACRRIDEETGEEVDVEEYTQVFHAWSGVVIS